MGGESSDSILGNATWLVQVNVSVAMHPLVLDDAEHRSLVQPRA